MSRRPTTTNPERPDPDGEALDVDVAALDAEGLRDLVRTLVAWLDGSTRGRVLGGTARRAWRPGAGRAGASEAVVDVEAFAARAERDGYAEPPEVDCGLRLALRAYGGRDDANAFRIDRARWLPISAAEMDRDQEELVAHEVTAIVREGSGASPQNPPHRAAPCCTPTPALRCACTNNRSVPSPSRLGHGAQPGTLLDPDSVGRLSSLARAVSGDLLAELSP